MSKTIKKEPVEELGYDNCCGKALKLNDKRRKIKYIKDKKK